MTKVEFVEWLEDIGARFEDFTEFYNGVDTIYVFSAEEYDLHKAHPKEFMFIPIPYIQVTWHDDKPEVFYAKWNGMVSFLKDDEIKMVVKEFTYGP